MRTYLITYDIATPARHSSPAPSCSSARPGPARSTTPGTCNRTERADALEGRLKAHLDGEDGLLIQQVEANAVLLNTALRWFKKRRQDAADADQCGCVPSACVPEAKAA